MRTMPCPRGEITMYSDEDKIVCPKCHVRAVVPLTAAQRRKQPDATTHVCHPALGGCNWGFVVARHRVTS